MYPKKDITRKVAHNMIIQIVGKIISTFLGLAALSMMARYLSVERFGWYITTISFLQFIGILTDFGMTPVTAQMMSGQKHNKKDLFKNLLGFRFVTAVFFFCLAPLLAMFFPYPMKVKIAIGFTSISFMAIAMNQVLVGLYQIKLKMHIQAISEAAGRMALVAGIWLVTRMSMGFLPIMGVVTAASLVYTSILWIRGGKETSVKMEFDWNVWKEIIKKMWPIAISIIFNVIYLKGDLVLLSIFAEQTDMAFYGAAYRVLDVITQGAMMVMGLFLPLLAFSWSRSNKREFEKRYQQSFDAMMALAVPMAVGIIVLANPIMILIAGAGKGYSHSASLLRLLSVAVFGVYLGAVFGHAAVAMDKQKKAMWVYVSNAIITFAGYLVFIPIYGMYGAAWMSVFSEIYAGILLFFVARHYSKVTLKINTLGKIIFSSLAMWGGLLLFKNTHVIILIIIGIIIYSAAMFAVGGVTKRTIKEIIYLK